MRSISIVHVRRRQLTPPSASRPGYSDASSSCPCPGKTCPRAANPCPKILGHGNLLKTSVSPGRKSVSQNFGTRTPRETSVSPGRKSVSQNFGTRKPREQSLPPVRKSVSQNFGTWTPCPNKLSIHTQLDYQDKKPYFQMRLSIHRTFKRDYPT